MEQWIEICQLCNYAISMYVVVQGHIVLIQRLGYEKNAA